MGFYFFCRFLIKSISRSVIISLVFQKVSSHRFGVKKENFLVKITIFESCTSNFKFTFYLTCGILIFFPIFEKSPFGVSSRRFEVQKPPTSTIGNVSIATLPNDNVSPTTSSTLLHVRFEEKSKIQS